MLMADARSLVSLCCSFHPPFLPSKFPILFPSLPPSPSSSSKHSSSSSSFKLLLSPKPSSSSSSEDSVSVNFGIVSTTEHSDGSMLFQFGDVSEISDKVDEEVTNSSEEVKSHSELVDSVKEVGKRLSDNVVSDVKSSDETHVPEAIYFRVLNPVNISELESVAKEGTGGSNSKLTSSAVGLELESDSSGNISQEQSEECTSELIEPNIEAKSTVTSEGASSGVDHSTQYIVENNSIENGGKGDLATLDSFEDQVSLDSNSTLTPVDEEPIEQPALDASDEKEIQNNVDKKPTEGRADEELVDQQTGNLVAGEHVHTAVDDETAFNLVDEVHIEQLTDNAVKKGPTHTTPDEKPTFDAANEVCVEQPTSDEVDTESPHILEPVLTSVEEPTRDIVDEEMTQIGSKSTSAVVEVEPFDNEKVEDLKTVDGNLHSSRYIEKAAEADVESSSDGDVLVHHVAKLQTSEATETWEEVSTSRLFLSSGAISLPHPSKALTGREDAYFIDQNWLGIADGVGQWSLDGISTGQYAHELMESCGKIVTERKSISTSDPMAVLNKAAMATKSSGSSTALIAHFDGQALRVANIGDSGFVVLRNETVFMKSSPMDHDFYFPLQIGKGDNPSGFAEVYNIDLDEGDVIVTASDGLFDNLYLQEIASIVSNSLQASRKPEEIAEVLARRAQEVGQLRSVRCPFADKAKAAGYVGFCGGKPDHVTVIVSFLHQTSSSLLH